MADDRPEDRPPEDRPDGGGEEAEIIHLGEVRNAVDAARPARSSAGRAGGGRRKAGAPPAASPSIRQPDEKAFTYPPDCPVIALGSEEGVHYYLDTQRQLRAVHAEKHGRLTILDLFRGETEYLKRIWPRITDGRVSGWRPEAAAEALMDGSKHLWSPKDRVRGKGSWKGAGGELIVHVGTRVLVVDGDSWVWHRPGIIGEHVYPAEAGIPAPDNQPVDPKLVRRVVELGATWSWRREDLDPVLLLGCIGAGILGGALDWRPVPWVTGGAGSGKSTLREHLIEPLYGIGAVVSATAASAAGIWQRLEHAALPVMVDEIEAAVDDRKQQALIELARCAASGGRVLRGGADHQGVDFTVYSTFSFFSILIPSIRGQDMSRVLPLELLPLGSREPPLFDAVELGRIGLALRSLLAQRWERLKQRLAWYRAELRQAGLDARASETYGTPLAIADALLWESVEDEDANPRELVAMAIEACRAERPEGEGRDEDELIAHVLSSMLQPTPSTRLTVAEAILGALDRRVGLNREDCRRWLSHVGLRIEVVDGVREHLAVANKHRGLAKLLADTHWAGQAGGSSVWVQATRRLAQRLGGVEQSRTLWFAGAASRAVLLPVDALGLEGM